MRRKSICALIGAVATIAMPVSTHVASASPLPKPRPALRAAHDAAHNSLSSSVKANVPLPRKRPGIDVAAQSAFAQAGVAMRGGLSAAHVTFKPLVRPVSGPFAVASTTSSSASDIAALKRLLEFARKGKDSEADAAKAGMSDPVLRKLGEWAILRSDNTHPSFQRYAAFIRDNPDWPHVPLFRRRAENALWNDRIDDATVREFFAHRTPSTAKGKFAYARALFAQGDRTRAEALVRDAWRNDDFSPDVEHIVFEQFGRFITRADNKFRMNKRLYKDDTAAGLRAAERLGGSDLAIAKAWQAVIKRASNAKALLDAVPSSARHDAGYIFARASWLRRNDHDAEAATLMLTAPNDVAELVDTDEWWTERRLLVRKLLDDGKAEVAYRVARDSPTPAREVYRVDRHFTAGWIALRFLHDPATAARHFAQIAEHTVNPFALGRAGYWQGRAAEAMKQPAQAKAFYQMGAAYSTTYYGQLARARLGLTDLGLRGPPHLTAEEHKVLSNIEVARAVEALYKLDERDMVASIYAELGHSATDVAGLTILGETAARHHDGRAMVLLGQAAVSRGLPLDYFAFPTVGLPEYKPIAPAVDSAVTYSIARQESHFNQKVVSPAHAMGLMQVTPVAAQDTAKRFKAHYDRHRLLSDPVYNMQMGAAELSNLMSGYRGSYLLTFAGYNAGRGRVRQWIAAHGDPRDPTVDPIDWVELIPISETRNYVQRIMENLQVYRARFGGGSRLLIEADLKRDTGPN